MPKLDSALQAAIGVPMPELEALDEKAQQQLAQDLTAAHQAHDAFLQKSMEDALNHVPRLLRGAFKKVLGL